MSTPTWWATAAVHAAASVLPGEARRRRYRQEFVSELAGLTPGAQARHAAGVVAGTWALRAALNKSIPVEEQENDVSLFGRVLCRVGVHRWKRQRNPEDGAEYLECTRCLKEKDAISLLAAPGVGISGIGISG